MYHIRSLPKATHSDRDRGATALVVAVCMVVLLGFAAVAVDATGLGFNERRQDQSAADVGALAAVQFAVTANLGNGCTGTNSQIARCNGANEAIEVANATLDDPSLANWSDATKCSSRPAGYTATAVSPCVAFNSNLDRAWVRIPTIQQDTTLAKAIGIHSISTTADAIAGTEYDPPGGVLPFLLPGNAAGSDYNCLKAAANPDFGPCEDLPVVGNFGSADIFLYGNSFLGYTSQCTGDSNGRLTANIARGADHPLSVYTAPGPEVQEWSNCPIAGAQPNTLNGQPGVGSGLEAGLAYGGTAYAASSYPGAIQDASGFTVRDAGGPKGAVQLDNIPLWNHLKTGLGAPCNKAQVDTPLEMDLCLASAKLAGTEIFDDSLADAKRFGWVPELLEADFTGNPYHIVDFRPVYLDTTYYSCNATQCEIMHTPGVGSAVTPACPATPADTRITCGTPGNWNKDMAAVTAYVLSKDIVPEAAKAPPPGSSNQRSYNLID